MARGFIHDTLMTHTFWLMDIGPSTARSLPIFNPLLGFSSITSPDIELKTETVEDGTWSFDRKVVVGAAVGNITLSRGCLFYDADFYNWLRAAQYGDTELDEANPLGGTDLGRRQLGGLTPRRNLMLVQFFNRTVMDPGPGGDPQRSESNIAGQAVRNSLLALSGAGPLSVAASAASTVAGGVSPFQFAARIPARAFILHGALPARFKPAGDFDASGAAISIQELEISLEGFEQVGLG
jgi:hypothetical protein